MSGRKRQKASTKQEQEETKKYRLEFRPSSVDDHVETLPQPSVEPDEEIVDEKPPAPHTGKMQIKKKSAMRRLQASCNSQKSRKYTQVKVQVSRSVKERLATMDRIERRKFLRELRNRRRPYADLAKKAKELWEVARSGKTSDKKKEEAVNELIELVRGKASQLIYAHDTVRVVQCLLALNRADVRTMLFDELHTSTLRMCKSRYAKHFVTKMLKCGTAEQRATIMRAMRGKCVELLRHAYAGDVLELAYNDYANGRQRSEIAFEFFGPHAALTLLEEGDAQKALGDLLAKNTEKRQAMMARVRETLLTLADRDGLRFSLTHRLMRDYLRWASEEQKVELADAIRERLLDIVHTKDGCICAMEVVWRSSAKERKIIIKALRSLVKQTCVDEHGSLFMMALLDCVDDTVLLNKNIIHEIGQNLPEIMSSRHGLRVVDYLVCPRDGRLLVKELRELLARGDANASSKKNAVIRRSELRAYAAPVVADNVARYMKEYLYEKAKAVFVVSLLETTDASTKEHIKQIPLQKRKECYEAITEVCQIVKRVKQVSIHRNAPLNFYLRTSKPSACTQSSIRPRHLYSRDWRNVTDTCWHMASTPSIHYRRHCSAPSTWRRCASGVVVIAVAFC